MLHFISYSGLKYDTLKNKAEWKVVKSNEDQIVVRAEICQEEIE